VGVRRNNYRRCELVHPYPLPSPNHSQNPNYNDKINFNPFPSLNQWVLLELPGQGNQKQNEINMTVVTMECAGVLEGATALVVLNHIEASWARGQEAVALLRGELPGDNVETLAPLRNGGVHLQKLFGVMHDTCHAANKVLPYLRTIPLSRPHTSHPNATLTLS
jgi:hypothetical protein